MTYTRLTDAQREILRANLIREQLDKSEIGLVAIIDGSHAADVHVLNALNITTDAKQGEALATILAKMHEARCATWSALGIANSGRF